MKWWLLTAALCALLVASLWGDEEDDGERRGAVVPVHEPLHPREPCFDETCDVSQRVCCGPRDLRRCVDGRWQTERCESEAFCSLGGCMPASSYDGAKILYDNIHSTKQHPTLELERDNYQYQGMGAYHRLFNHLQLNGYAWWDATAVGATLLTDELLADYGVLFINLVTDDMPDFTSEEIGAVHRFVKAGGGLVVIAEHTNVYLHAEKTNPVIEPLGIRITYTTALDTPPEYGAGSVAWIIIRNFTDHPINDGIEVASFQTGAALDTELGTAFTSSGAFADFWIQAPGNRGQYGDFLLDEGERRGTLPVIAARAYGKGRVVVVGDQNVFGDEWGYVGHNFELASNIFEWVAQNDGADVPLRDRKQEELHYVAFELDRTQWNISWPGRMGFLPFFINFNRQPTVAARGVSTLLDVSDLFTTVVITNPAERFGSDEIEAARAHLRRGGTIVALNDVQRGAANSWQLVAELLPDLEVRGKVDVGVSSLPDFGAFETLYADEELPVSSPLFDVQGMAMSGHEHDESVACWYQADGPKPYVTDVTAKGGTPILTADVGGRSVDLARLYEVEGGELIVFFQFGFWRSETLGTERELPSTLNGYAHQVEYAFIDWLQTL